MEESGPPYSTNSVERADTVSTAPASSARPHTGGLVHCTVACGGRTGATRRARPGHNIWMCRPVCEEGRAYATIPRVRYSGHAAIKKEKHLAEHQIGTPAADRNSALPQIGNMSRDPSHKCGTRTVCITLKREGMGACIRVAGRKKEAKVWRHNWSNSASIFLLFGERRDRQTDRQNIWRL